MKKKKNSILFHFTRDATLGGLARPNPYLTRCLDEFGQSLIQYLGWAWVRFFQLVLNLGWANLV